MTNAVSEVRAALQSAVRVIESVVKTRGLRLESGSRRSRLSDEQYAAQYAATLGKTPASSVERTELLRVLAGKVEAQPRRHPRAV